MTVSFDSSLYARRLATLHSSWKKHHSFKKLQSLVFYVNDESDTDIKDGLILQRWLFGYEFKNTIFVLTDNSFFCLTSPGKIKFLNPLLNSHKPGSPKLVLITRSKADESSNYETLIEAISGPNNALEIGVFYRDKPIGSLTSDFNELLSLKFSKENISPLLSEIIMQKEAEEISMVENSSHLLSGFYKRAKNVIYQSIQNSDKITNISISKKILSYASSDEFMTKNQSVLSEALVTYPLKPLIISGGKGMKPNFKSSSNEKRLHLNSIINILNVSYNFYNSNMARTIMINATPSKAENYAYAVSVINYIFTILKPGSILGQIYSKIIEFVRSSRQDLLANVIKNFGFSTGLDVFDKNIQIVQNSNYKLMETSVLTIQVGFEDLEAADARSTESNYSIFIADTVVVRSDGVQLLTKNNKEFKFISISYEDHRDENKENYESDSDDFGNFVSKSNLADLETRNITRKKPEFQEAINYEKTQKNLKYNLYENTKNVMQNTNPVKNKEEVEAKIHVSYKKFSNLPKNSDIANERIFVDKSATTVIFPIFGQPYPVHISKIKNMNLNSSNDSRESILRINFNTPLSFYRTLDNQQTFHIKELHYRASDQRSSQMEMIPSTHLVNALNSIKELQKIEKKLAQASLSEDLSSAHEPMTPVSGGQRIVLHNVFMRPFTSLKRSTGNLEAFSNGFTFTKTSGEKYYIPYSMIKCAFYQPCDEKNCIIALHLRLKKVVSVGSKKSEDIQFFNQSGELSTNLEIPNPKRHKGSNYDEDSDEEHEENRMKMLRSNFRKFCMHVEEASGNTINFERPDESVCFFGNPFRSFVKIYCTDNYMMSIIEWPAFVLDINDVELVYFERDIQGLKTCDMVFIFKDYTTKVYIMRSVDKENLNTIKIWLTNHNIPFFAGIQALSWPTIMSTILEDPQGFIENGTWKFLEVDDSEEENDSQEQEVESSSLEESEEDEDDIDEEEDNDENSEEDEDSDKESEEVSEEEEDDIEDDESD